MPRTPSLSRAVASILSAALVVTSPGLGCWEAAAQSLRSLAPEAPVPLSADNLGVVAVSEPGEIGAPALGVPLGAPLEVPLSALPLAQPMPSARGGRERMELQRSIREGRSESRASALGAAFDRSRGLTAAPDTDAEGLGKPLGSPAPAAAPTDLGLSAEDRAAITVFTSQVQSEAARKFPEYGFTVRDYHAWVRFLRFFTPSLGVTEALKRGAVYVYGDRLNSEKERKEFDSTLSSALSTLKLSQKDFGKDPKKAAELRRIAEPSSELVAADEASPFRMPVSALVPKKEQVDLVLTAGTLKRMEAAYQAFALRDYMLMTGPPATLKSAIVKYLASEYEIPHLAVNMHPGIGTFELVGGYRPRDIKITDLADARKLVAEALAAAKAGTASSTFLDSGRMVYGGHLSLEGLLASVEKDLGAGETAATVRRLLTLAHGLAFGSNSLVWVDGYLSYAIKRDIWITFEELNAAPTEVLEFLNDFMRSRRLVVTQKLGEAETLTPREGGRFMLWATKNDDNDSNRNVLAATLTNRWRVKAFGALPALEQAEILEKKFGLPTLWAVALVQNFHDELQRQANEREIGADWRDGYSINLRHLLKVARRWKHFVDQETEETGRTPDKSRKLFLLAREAYSVYAGMMRRQDERDGAYRLLDQALKLHGAGVTQQAITEPPKMIEDLGDRLRIGDVVLRKGKGGPFVPKPNPDYLADEVVYARCYEYAKALAMGEPLLLMGETAAGKTSDLEYLFFRLNRNLRYKNLDSDTAIEDVVGGPLKKNGVYGYEEGLLPAAMDEGTGAFLDELNLNPLVEWLNTVADDGRLFLPHRIVQAAEDFSLVAAANPPDPRYEGRILLSPAVRSRLTEIWVPLDVSAPRLARLMDHWLKGGTIYSLLLAASLGAAWVHDTVAGVLSGLGAGFGPKKKVLSVFSRIRDWFRRRKPSPNGGGEEPARPQTFEDLLKEKGIPPEKWPEMRAKADRIRTIVRMVGMSVGRDTKLRFEPGYLWAFFPEQNLITYPFEHLLTHSEDEIVGLTDHEGSHREFTIFDSRYPLVRKYTEDPHKMFLWNALEDPRVNNGTIRRLPGSERYFHAAYDRYLPENLEFDPKEQEKLAKKGPDAWLNPEGDGASAFNPQALKLPHIEYLMAANYYWRHGKEPPKWNNASARDAFQKTRAAMDDIFMTLPPAHDSAEDLKLAAQLQTLEKIDKHILPVYEPLVKQSESLMKQMMKGKQGGKGKEGGQGQPGPGQPPQGPPKPGGDEGRPKEDKKDEKQGGGGKEDGKEKKEKRSKEDAQAEAMLREHARKAAESLGSKLKTNPKKKDAPVETSPKPEKGKEDGKGEKPGGGDDDPTALTIQDIADAQVKNALSVSNQGYKGTYRSVAGTGNQMVSHLENVFLKNARPRDQGYYKKGKRPDLKRVMRREGEGSERDDVWLRRTQKTKRRYKVTILVDESGSMSSFRDEALRGVVLFIESLSRLQIDIEVIGFGEKALVHKSFGRPMSPADKEKLFDELHKHVGQAGATHDADALQLAVERIEKEEADRRMIFVVTDGQGNGPSKLSAVFPRAVKSKIRVVGVGIGAGMSYVKEAYPHHAMVERIEELPTTLRKTLEEYIRLEEMRAGPKPGGAMRALWTSAGSPSAAPAFRPSRLRAALRFLGRDEVLAAILTLALHAVLFLAADATRLDRRSFDIGNVAGAVLAAGLLGWKRKNPDVIFPAIILGEFFVPLLAGIAAFHFGWPVLWFSLSSAVLQTLLYTLIRARNGNLSRAASAEIRSSADLSMLNERTYRWLVWLAGTRDERAAALREMEAAPAVSWPLRKPVEALARIDPQLSSQAAELLEFWDREAPVSAASLQPAGEGELRGKAEGLLAQASLAAASEPDTPFGRVRRRAIEDAAEALRSALSADVPAELELSLRRLEAALDAASGGSTGLAAAPQPAPPRDAEFEIGMAQTGSIVMAAVALAGGAAGIYLAEAGVFVSVVVASFALAASLHVRGEETAFPLKVGAIGLMTGALAIGAAGLLYPDWIPAFVLGCLAAALLLGGFAGVREAELLRPQFGGAPKPAPAEPVPTPRLGLRAGSERLLESARAHAAADESLVELTRAVAVASAARDLERALSIGDEGDLALAERRLKKLLER
jgi:MoxR-like ATPase/Mg-chelatase subunit ChlD